ncbi:MAG TPA: hypothetical protein VGG85_08525 [Terracidiphilus sp.]|jgi:hypothetical protein
MPTVHEKLVWLEAITRSAQRFVAAGGELKSTQAAPIGLALFHAMKDLAAEFGFETAKPASPPGSRRQPGAPPPEV